MIFRQPVARLGLIASIDAAALVLLAPDWSALAAHLAAPNEWIAQDGGDSAASALAAAALWLCSAWLAVGLLAMLGSAAPGRLGAASRGLCAWAVPATVLRLVGGVAGLSITLSVAAPLASAATPAVLAGSAAHGASAVRAIPATHREQAVRATSTAVTQRAPAQGLLSAATGSPPTWPLSPPVVSLDPPTSKPAVHTVVPGDCLWSLAAHQLDTTDPAQIQAQTQQWYAANRVVIGADPGLLRPGQHLVVPGTAS